MRIAVIDCAVERPAYECFNQLVDFLEMPLTYHHPVKHGLQSLERSFPECLVVLGSYSNLDEKLEWHKPLQKYLMDSLEKHTPVLGLCFGHQIVAQGFGAKVRPAAKSYYGPRVVKPFKNSRGVLKDRELTLIAAHSQEVVELPDELELIASSDQCENDIIAHKGLPFLGVQTHPEASVHFIEQNLYANGHRPDREELEKAQSDGLKLIDDFLLSFKAF